MLLGAQVLYVTASAGLAMVTVTRGPVWIIYALLALNGIANAFQSPAKGAFLPQVVPAEALSNGMTWNSGAWQLAAVLGPAAGGAVIGMTHAATLAFVLGGLGTSIFAVALLLVRKTSIGTANAEKRDLMSGLRFVLASKVILATITLDMFAVLLGGATSLLPVFAKDILHVGPSGLGWLAAAPSTGAVIVAFALAHRPPMRRAGRTLLIAVCGFGLATIAFGLSRSFWFSLLMLMALGGFDMVSVVIRATLVPLLTPDEMRGRVAAINGVFIGTSNELGAFESGTLAWLIGPMGSVVFGGIGTIVTVIAIAWVWPEVRRITRLEAPS